MWRVITIMSSFRCPACDEGVCALPRPALVVSGGGLRPASEAEIAELKARGDASREPVRLSGSGKEGLEKLLSEGGAPGGASAEGFLITCTCGHLFLEQLPPA
jgi:hypothetical protein